MRVLLLRYMLLSSNEVLDPWKRATTAAKPSDIWRTHMDIGSEHWEQREDSRL